MKPAVPEGPPSWGRGEVYDVSAKCASCTRMDGSRSQHSGHLQNKWNISLTNRAQNDFRPRDGQRVDTLPTQTKEENSRKAEGEPRSDGLKSEITTGFLSERYGSSTAQPGNSDFHSPRQLTNSSLGRYTTASDRRLPRGEDGTPEFNVTAIRNRNEIQKNVVEEGVQMDPEPRSTHGDDGNKYIQSETRRCLTTNEFRCARPCKESSHHSALVQVDSSKYASCQPLLPAESLRATRRGKQRSIPESFTSTTSDLLSARASDGIRHQGNICAGEAPRKHTPLSITSSRTCAVVTTGGRSVCAGAHTTNETNDSQFLPLFESPSWQRCARQERSSECRKKKSITGKTPTDPHPQVRSVRSKATDGASSSHTTEYQHSSTEGEETYSDASAGALSWIDYPVDAEKTTCNTKHGASSCNRIGEKTLPNSKMQFLKQPELLVGQPGERCELKNVKTKGRCSTINCDSDGSETNVEGPGPPEESVCVTRDACEMQKAYVCQRGSMNLLGSDRTTAVKPRGAAETEHVHRSRGSWANASRWKARLDFSRSHSRGDDDGCEHGICMGTSHCGESRNNCTRRVSEALRRKVGDAVNRLRCKRTHTPVRREHHGAWCSPRHHGAWYPHGYRKASPTVPGDAECTCQKDSQQMDTHPNNGIQAKDVVHAEGQQSRRQSKALWVKRESRGGDTTDAEASTRNNESIKEKPGDALGPQHPSIAAASVSATADREEALSSQLPRYYYPLSSASKEEPNTLDTNNQSSRRESFGTSSASDFDESEIRGSTCGSQLGYSVEDGRFMRLDRVSAGTTQSTSTTGSGKRFESYRRRHGKQMHQQNTPGPAALEPLQVELLTTAQPLRARELLGKNCPHSGVEEEKETGGLLSRTLSDVITQASAERLRNYNDISKHENACHCGDISQNRNTSSQEEKLPIDVHSRPDGALASINRSQSLDSRSMKRESSHSQCSRTHRSRGGSSAITLSDVEASIDWIVEASSNPRLLRAARRLLLKKETAERLAGFRRYNCGIRNPPAYYYANFNSCIHLSTGQHFNANTTTLKQSSRAVVSLEESTEDGASSGQSSSDNHPFCGRNIRAATRRRQSGADTGLPGIPLYERGTAQTHRNSRHTYRRGTRIVDSESDSEYQSLRLRMKSRHQTHAQTYARNGVGKTFLCYAPSDVAWNTDQLI